MKAYKIGVVGPCASGKSTLVKRLISNNIYGKNIAQEHSAVPDMWRRLTNPDLLIYLDVSYPNTIVRRQLNWTEREYRTQLKRLQNARQNADLYVCTDNLSPNDVLDKVLAFLNNFV